MNANNPIPASISPTGTPSTAVKHSPLEELAEITDADIIPEGFRTGYDTGMTDSGLERLDQVSRESLI